MIERKAGEPQRDFEDVGGRRRFWARHTISFSLWNTAV